MEPSLTKTHLSTLRGRHSIAEIIEFKSRLQARLAAYDTPIAQILFDPELLSALKEMQNMSGDIYHQGKGRLNEEQRNGNRASPI